MLPALGQIFLNDGRYGDYIIALRDWIVQFEQFKPGNSRLGTVGIHKVVWM